MKKIIIFLLILGFSFSGQFRLKKVWETPNVLKVPESVLYDSSSGFIYVSNINGSPSAQDGNGFISKLSKEGKIVSLRWCTGLDAPKGMAIYQGKLYVSDIHSLAEIDLKTGKILHRYPAAGSQFLNDVVADGKGNIYVSDSSPSNSVIYILKQGKLRVWIKEPELLKSPNGVAFKEGILYFGSFADGRIFSSRPGKPILKLAARSPIPTDGLIPFNGGFIVSDWKGKIGIVNGKNFHLLIDLTREKKNAADLGYIPEEKIILVPTFFDNRVIAYKLIQ